MPEIYKTAEHVFAWLGYEADDSDNAIRYLRELGMKWTEHTTVESASEESPIWDSINRFFGREWFRRVWIVQELVLAPKVTLLCGGRRAQWDDIYNAAKICSDKTRGSTAAIMTPIAQKLDAILNLGDLKRNYHRDDGSQGELLTLFERFQHTKATLQRDKLFALLGLANDANEPEFYPDYDSPLEVIVKRQTITTWPSNEKDFCAFTRGYIIDSIKRVGETSFESSDRTLYLKELFQTIQSLNSYPNGDSVEDLVWKIPIGDASEPTSGTWEDVNFRTSYQAFTEYLQLGEQSADLEAEAREASAMYKTKQFLFRSEELRKLMWLFLYTAQAFAESTRKNEEGRYCLHHTRERSALLIEQK
ncbi:hypothetical protein ONZ43_g7111 [Nemania bipapillata]|uniref:Uncharacterized protein n=1 Tax=Nemania bipapillata TaxID=110536 RepID=A0ACC2HUT5_9PEZI|nr:hypothetical protein ONZ43_g7111 [Nemania bipapillata]